MAILSEDKITIKYSFISEKVDGEMPNIPIFPYWCKFHLIMKNMI